MARKTKTSKKSKPQKNWQDSTQDLLDQLAKKSGSKVNAYVFTKTGDLLFRSGKSTSDTTVIGALVTAGESLRVQLNSSLNLKAGWIQFGEGKQGYWLVSYKEWTLFVSGGDWKPKWMEIFKQLAKKRSEKSGTSEALEGLAPAAVDAAFKD